MSLTQEELIKAIEDAPYHDEYGNSLESGYHDDLMAGGIQHSLCRRCGLWYAWNDTHASWDGGGCLVNLLKGSN